tara:strand:- start:14172 stop:15788 length:1617 start_codon:yes stop_codon:yes gene_type:complete
MWKDALKQIKIDLGMDNQSTKKNNPEKMSVAVLKEKHIKPKIPKKEVKKYLPNSIRKNQNKVGKKSNKKKTENLDSYHLISHIRESNRTDIVKPRNELAEFKIAEIKSPDRQFLKDFIKNESSVKFAMKAITPVKNRSDVFKELVIGLDFGTAFTKVVVGETTYAYAIPFNGFDYLLPSELHVNELGTCFLQGEPQTTLVKDLKLPLVLANASDLDRIAIVAFLALVFHASRKWVEDNIFKDYTIDWLVNAGLPTSNYHDKVLKALYTKLINAAWSLSFIEVITINAANAILHDDSAFKQHLPIQQQLSVDSLNLFPEFAAQIVGYVQSPARREFSHLLVDVGAGTLDVAMFIVKNENGDWMFETNGKGVETLGADILLKHRVGSLNQNLKIEFIDSYPDAGEIITLFGIKLKDLARVDAPFKKAVNLSLKKVISSVAAGYSFGVDITTFICGGGASVGLFREEVEAVKGRYPLSVISLPLPRRLKGKSLNASNYHRLSVAYGLSFDPFNIGKVISKNVDARPPSKASPPSSYLLDPS